MQQDALSALCCGRENSIKWGISPRSLKKKFKLRRTKPFPAQTEGTLTNSSGFELVCLGLFLFYMESDISYSVGSNVLLVSTVFPIPQQVMKVNGKQNKMQHKLIMIKA